MDKTLSALGDILLKALPTFFLVIFLYVYLRKIFFQPLEEVLQARREATEGERRRAEEVFQKAEQKATEYEAALQSARTEIYRERELERQRTLESHAARLREARARADAHLKEARDRIAREVAEAKNSLAVQGERLAEQVVRAVLEKGTVAS